MATRQASSLKRLNPLRLLLRRKLKAFLKQQNLSTDEDIMAAFLQSTKQEEATRPLRRHFLEILSVLGRGGARIDRMHVGPLRELLTETPYDLQNIANLARALDASPRPEDAAHALEAASPGAFEELVQNMEGAMRCFEARRRSLTDAVPVVLGRDWACLPYFDS